MLNRLDRAVREQNLSAIPAILFISIFWAFLFQRVVRVQNARHILSASHIEKYHDGEFYVGHWHTATAHVGSDY